MATLQAKPLVTVDGQLNDWSASERIDYNDVPGYSLYAQEQGGSYYFALTASQTLGAGTTFWLNTDLNTATGYEIFGLPTGADFNVMIGSDGTASLYTGAAGQTLVLANISLAYSADHKSVEFAIPATAIGNPSAIDTLYQVNGTPTVYGPSDYTAQPYVAFGDSSITRTSSATRIAIVYSATTAANYFSTQAYSDLIMNAEAQAMEAGVPFDLISESDLTNLSKVSNYSAIVFPSFTNVQSSQVTAITNTLLQATKQFGIGLITSGDFMTNDQTGAALSGDPYACMKVFFDATRTAGGNSDNVTITSSDTNRTVFTKETPGATIASYTGVGWTAYQSVSGTGTTIATETVNGQNYAAALATQTAGNRNVLFSSNGVMANNNLLGQAIDYVAKGPGLSVSLDMTRFKGILATRMDMDQSQFPSDVSPASGAGIYDKLIPILQSWKTQYDFVGSYYINIGDNPTPTGTAEPSNTDWTKSLAYYKAILAMGGEIGNHSYSHLINPPTQTFTATTANATSAGATQITLNSLPSFAGVTVGMIVSGLNIGSNTPVPGVAGQGGTVANTFVTAVSGNTVTLSYVPGGYGTANDGVLGNIPAGTTLTFSLPPENTNFLQTGTGTVTSADGHPFTYDYEFNQSKLLEQQMLGVPIYGAAIPGAAETPATDLNIFPYYQSVAASATTPGYTGYVTGGWTGIGSGYPDAFGFINPSTENTVYIAPNLNFDFTEIQYEGKTVAQAEADWNAQIASLAAGAAGPPILVWPIHDYGAAAWDTSGTGTSPYTTQMFTDLIANTYRLGYESVTLEDLASRIQSFAASNITSSVNGNVITATATSANAGEFALNVAGAASGQIIENVGSYYAYNNTGVFVPANGGTFTITMGTTVDAVTHIVSLPMRGELLSVTGDGTNLSFSVIGDGDVLIDLGGVGGQAPVVTGAGAAIASQTGNQLDVRLTGLGEHDVSLRMLLPGPTETVASVAFSADTGASATDLVTNIAAQTITGTLSAALATGDIVQVSLDNGVTWTNANATVGATTFSLSGAVLTGSGTLVARVANSAGTPSAALSRAYVLDTTPPAETVAIVAMTDDSGIAGDFITNNGAAGRTVSGTLSAAAATGETLRVSFDGGLSWLAPTVSGTAWSLIDAASHTANWTIEAEVVDLAGNIGPITTRAVTLDTTVPIAPSVPDLAAASDSGISSTDNLTNVKTPTFIGTAEAGATVTLYDGAKVIGTGTVTANGTWSIVAAALADGIHSVSATATDVAGNIGAASAALAVTIDTVAPVAPSQPHLAPGSDSGSSSTDNITNVATPAFTGTAEAGSTVTLLDGITTIGTATASSIGAWSITAGTLADGVHRITAKTVDAAGNTSIASNVLSVTVDRTAPAAPMLVSGSSLSLLGLNAFTITGKGEAGDALSILKGTTSVTTVNVGSGGTWSWSFIATSSPQTFNTVQTDKAGNKSVSSGLIVTGTNGADNLSGGSGNDLFLGGAGADTFSFTGVFGSDIIADFHATGTAHDIINFHASATLNSFASAMSHATQVGTSVVISQEASDTVTLLNVNRTSLSAGDFKFV